MALKNQYSARDKLAAQLVLIVVFGLILLGGLALYMTGLFDSAPSGYGALADTQPLDLATQPPKSSLLSWLFASAGAEGVPAEADETDADENEVPAQTPAIADLDSLVTELTPDDGSDITDADVITIDKKDLSVNKNLPSDWFNVLLLGLDTRTSDLSKSRSDVMIIASVNGKTGEVKLVSLARDMYVTIPNKGQNRINTAFAYGGWPLAVKTVNQNFEMNIENYVAVNFIGMASFIDTLGGVDIPLVGKEYEQINYNVAVSEDYEGFAKSTARRRLTEADTDMVVHLDGLQAVAYARIRKLDDDLQRNSRQRTLVESLMKKVLPLTTSTVYNLAMTATQYCEMLLPMVPGTRVGNLIGEIVKAPSIEISNMSIPIQGSYHPTIVQDSNGKSMDVLSFSQQTNVEELHKFIYGEYIPADKK